MLNHFQHEVTMEFFHVLAVVGGGKVRVLFSDLSLGELKKQFVTPYKKGEIFFAGHELVTPSELKEVRVIKSSDREDVIRENLNREDRKRIDEINRDSRHCMFIGPGGGFEPGDLAGGGLDVTRDFIVRGPGSRDILGASKVSLGWIMGIVASVLSAGLAKWVGWI